VGGTPEMIGNDERGLLFRSGDAGDLAEKLARLIGDVQLRRDLANRAAFFVGQNLSIEAATRRMTTIYLATLRRKTMGLQN
jgi:glycosyltransferase involved in cell wall biosynthesis